MAQNRWSQGQELKNVVIIGHSGAAKSSLINMLCPHANARVGHDTIGCTLEELVYTCHLGSGQQYNVHDTIGLEEPTFAFIPAPEANKRLKRYLQCYMEKKELHLVIYCMPGERFGMKQSQQKNYEDFKMLVGKVPVLLVVTKLDGDLDGWWERNQGILQKLGMESEEHACVTSLPRDPYNAGIHDVSRKVVEALISRKIFGGRDITVPPRDHVAMGHSQLDTDIPGKTALKQSGDQVCSDGKLKAHASSSGKKQMGDNLKSTKLKHAALHGAQHYDKVIESSQIMVPKVDQAPDMQMPKLRQQDVSDAEVTIRTVIHTHTEDFPPRLFDTTTGLLHDRDAQIDVFKTSTQYKELLSLTIKHTDRQLERVGEAILTYFRYAMLSHRWEGKEPLLHDIQDKVVYELKPVAGMHKLQSFCRVARDAGYRWAWSDTCCIDKSNHVELQESVNAMFVWYHRSALTVIYLSDVSRPGALAASAWNERGWTVQEFLAPKVVIFYQKDWSLYLDDRTPNHKKSDAIMEELASATGIDLYTLANFQPGMRGARAKLQWASRRVTTRQEDIAYSLFGIFGLHLPVIYGEKKQHALVRLLQEIIAQSGDITALDWVGKSSKFNSCLPADIASYEVAPCTLPSLSEDKIQTTVSFLRNTTTVELASNLFTVLSDMEAPRFANRRLSLPCIVFPVTMVRRIRHKNHATDFTHEVEAKGLNDLQIITKDKLVQFSETKPARQAFLLVRPWDRSLLELPDFADETQSVDDDIPPESPSSDSPSSDSLAELPTGYDSDDSEAHLRALRLIVHLGQPFAAFLLVHQSGKEYKRIASDHDIIAQVKDIASIDDTNVRMLEIL